MEEVEGKIDDLDLQEEDFDDDVDETSLYFDQDKELVTAADEDGDEFDEGSMLPSKHINSTVRSRQQFEEEESFSSDVNYFDTDEDTSSFAGSFDDLGKEDEDGSTSDQLNIPEQTREAKLQRLAIRKHLDELRELVQEREQAVQQSQEDLDKCKEHLEQLEIDLEEVEEEIKSAEEEKNVAAHSRLVSKRETLRTEINIEKEIKLQTSQNLEDAEFHLAQAYIEHGKFLPLGEQLEEEENMVELQKGEKTAARIKKEVAAVVALERKRRIKDKEQMQQVRERDRKERQSLIAAKKNRDIALKYLKETMVRVRQRESEEEDRSRVDMHQRMQALLNLKRNIEGNKESIKALQARDIHMNRQEVSAEKKEREQILAQGDNDDEVMTRRKRIRQFERDKEAFERRQREREISIVNKILTEEKQMKRRYQQQPQLFPDRPPRRMPRKRSKPRIHPSSGSESMEYGGDVEDTGGRVSEYSRLNKVSTDEEGEFSPYGAAGGDDEDDRETDEELEENLARPEFKGLWEEEVKEDAKELGDNWKSGSHEFSKYEKDMMKRQLSNQKKNIVQKQVAAGREFKGVAFYSKPEIVTFKDFDVGRKSSSS